MVTRYYKCLVLISVLLVLCVMMPFLLLYSYDISVDGTISTDTSTVTLRKALDVETIKSMNNQYDNLKLQIDELERIKVSVRNEMRELEKKRNDIIHETETQKASYYKLQSDIHQGQKKLTVLQDELVKVGHKLYAATPPPNIHQSSPPPIFIIADSQHHLPHSSDNNLSTKRHDKNTNGGMSDCESDIGNCIDITKCPLRSNLKFYVYSPESYLPANIRLKYPELLDSFITHLKDTKSLTDDSNEACLFIVLLGPIDDESSEGGPVEFEDIVYSLQHWGRNGMNHVLVNLMDIEAKTVLLDEFDPMKAIFVQNHIHSYYRPRYDVIAPMVEHVSTPTSLWRQLPPILPATRKFLLYFSGESVDKDGFIGHILKQLIQHVKDPVYIQLQCSGGPITNIHRSKQKGMALCGSIKDRWDILKQSTFTLVPDISYTGLIRLNEALKSGAVPVIIGASPLPFDSVIDWNEVAIIIPTVRLRELHYIIRNIPENRIVELRRQGRFVWETYFSSLSKVLINTVAILRYQLSHAPPPIEDIKGKLRVYGPNYQLVSPTFRYNSSIYNYQYWNTPPGPMPMFPSTPWDPAPISGISYSSMNDSQLKTLPPHILQAGGITGPFFENYLLGDNPIEYFTIVILTYKREEVVIESVEKLDKLKFLAKVIVVWNDLDKNPYELDWPQISAPVEVIWAEKNSLNNRFLPYESIHTEAILSMDDDVFLRHDEIQFAFRVWRESRDRLVGFPGRFHAFDVHNRKWLYNSNYTCELSMVLTGAAFYHKYYSYLYSYWQPQAVLELVDSKMNCEDIAMNYLIAHITRKPPLKVTSRWTFHCPNCPDTLSQSDAHFHERHYCMNKLTETTDEVIVRVYIIIIIMRKHFQSNNVVPKP